MLPYLHCTEVEIEALRRQVIAPKSYIQQMEHPREAPVSLNIFSKSLDCEWKPAFLSLPLLDPGVPPGTCRAWLLCLPSISHQGSALTIPTPRPTVLEQHSAALEVLP